MSNNNSVTGKSAGRYAGIDVFNEGANESNRYSGVGRYCTNTIKTSKEDKIKMPTVGAVGGTGGQNEQKIEPPRWYYYTIRWG